MSDYDAMTEREVMQLRVLRVAYHLEDACGPNGLLGPYSAEQADIVRGLLDDLHAVSAWLEAQPEAPEPDWTKAPDDGEMNKVKAQKILLRIAQIVQELRKKTESEPADAPYSVENIIEILDWLDAQPAAPEVMTIPEDVRNWIASAAQVASDSARYYDVDPSTSDAVLAWLDAH